MLSAMVHDEGPDGRMSRDALISNAALLLFTGHETSVNLIANSVLSLLRHPRELDKLRRSPGSTSNAPTTSTSASARASTTASAAPLARLEVQIAVGEFVRRVENPRVVTDPPPYRHNQIFRGPRHLLLDLDGIRD